MNCKLRRLDLLRTGQKSDCELHVLFTPQGQQKRCRRVFRCHQTMLVSASEEFERLIRDPEFEKNKQVITVDDASPTAYESLLLYIYTYEVCNAVHIEMCEELMLLAQRYKMYDFADCYMEKLASQDWPMEVVLQIFALANKHDHLSLMDVVAKKILPIATHVLNDNSFTKLSLQELKALMIILQGEGMLSNSYLLGALKNYQMANNLRYNDMEKFQQFVEVTQIFEKALFEVDGTLSVPPEEVNQTNE
ncbi:hypothetical protein KR074_009626, partial [Drosophila pseudoananassae]